MSKIAVVAGVVLCLFGCGVRPAEDGQPISGKLTVHTGLASPGQVVHVLLGDGTRFDKLADPQGDVVFDDPSLQGPQDISVVFVSADGTRPGVFTLVGIDRDDVWTGPAWLSSLPAGPGSQSSGSLTGKVTGIENPNDSVQVSLVPNVPPSLVPPPGENDILVGQSSLADPIGAFQIPTQGTAGTTANLVAREFGSDGTPRRLGMRSEVPLPATGDSANQDVALDHSFDQQLQVEVDNLSPYGAQVRASLWGYLGDYGIFETGAQGVSPLAVPTIARTPPFDGISLQLRVSVGDADHGISASQPVQGSSAQVSLPAPIALTAPTLGTRDAPAETPLAGLKASWSAGQPWQQVTVQFTQSRGSSPADAFTWSISGPGGEQSFTVFPLPADVGTTGLQPGPVEISASAEAYSDRSSLESYYGASQTFDVGAAGVRQGVHGFATLE